MRIDLEKFALSYLASFLYAPISFFAFLLASLESEATFLELSIQALIVTATVEMVLLLITALQLKSLSKNEKCDPYLFIAPFLIIGLIRGLLVTLVLNAFNDGASEPLYLRIPIGIISAFLWLGLLTYFINESRSYKQRFGALFSQAVLESIGENPGVSNLELDEMPEILGFKRDLNDLLNFENVDSNEKDRILLAASLIKSHINVVLRPLSHRLWISSDFQIPRFRYWRLFHDAITNLSFSTASVIVPWMALFFFGTLPYLPFLATLHLSLIFMSALIFPLLLAQLAIRLKLSGFFVLFLLALMYLLTPTKMTNILLEIWNLGYEVDISDIINPLTALTGICLVLFVSILRLIQADRSTLLSSIPQALDSIRQRKLMASYLHNSMQSQLTSIALQLESSSKQLVSAEAKSALERLGSLINREISSDFRATPRTLDLKLVQISDSWRGLADISFEGIRESELTPEEVTTLLFFFEEVVTNSVRYGGATAIIFKLRAEPEKFYLTASHDGTGEIVKGSGLGTLWLNEYAPQKWSISRENGSTILIAEIERVI